MSDAANAAHVEFDDCWNRIGVWGKQQPRCPKLDKIIHCRNCDVYSNAGRNMLERKLPEDYENTWARIYAQGKPESVTGTQSVTIFRLGEEWLALPTENIDEITDVCTLHVIPHHHGRVLRGLVNLRGQLKLCVSLGLLMDIDKGDLHTGKENKQRIYQRMIAVSHNNSDYVFLVSEVCGTHRYHPKELQSPPATLSQATGTYTRGIIQYEGREIACLDAELLFYSLEKSLA